MGPLWEFGFHVSMLVGTMASHRAKNHRVIKWANHLGFAFSHAAVSALTVCRLVRLQGPLLGRSFVRLCFCLLALLRLLLRIGMFLHYHLRSQHRLVLREAEAGSLLMSFEFRSYEIRWELGVRRIISVLLLAIHAEFMGSLIQTDRSTLLRSRLLPLLPCDRDSVFLSEVLISSRILSFPLLFFY